MFTGKPASRGAPMETQSASIACGMQARKTRWKGDFVTMHLLIEMHQEREKRSLPKQQAGIRRGEFCFRSLASAHRARSALKASWHL
jgi:hypothetical protein